MGIEEISLVLLEMPSIDMKAVLKGNYIKFMRRRSFYMIFHFVIIHGSTSCNCVYKSLTKHIVLHRQLIASFYKQVESLVRNNSSTCTDLKAFVRTTSCFLST